MASRDLNVDITTNALRFARDMGRAARATEQLGPAAQRANAQLAGIDRRLDRISRRSADVRRLFAGFITVATVRRIGQYAQNLASVSSSLVEQGEAFGIASDELEAFQRVLRGDGANVQQVNQGLSQLTRNIGLAAQGAGPAARVFTDLGIRLRRADGTIRGSLAVFRDFTRAVEGLDPAARAAATGLVIGEEAARTWAATIARGADNLDRAFGRERGFGLATDEQNRALKGLEDTVRTVIDSIQTLGRVLLSSFATQINGMLVSVREGVAAMIRMEQTTGRLSNVISDFIERIRRLLAALYRIRIVLQLVFSLTLAGKITRIFEPVFRIFGRVAVVSQRLVRVLRRLANRTLLRGAGSDVLAILAERLAALGVTLGTAGGIFVAFRSLGNAISGLVAPFRDFNSTLSDVAPTVEAAAIALRGAQSAFADLAAEQPAVAAGLRTQLDQIERQIRLLSDIRPETLSDFAGPRLAPRLYTTAQIDEALRQQTALADRLRRQLNAALFAPPGPAEEEAAGRYVGQLTQMIQDAYTALGMRLFSGASLVSLDDLRITEPFERIDRAVSATVDAAADGFNEMALAARDAASTISNGFADAITQAREFNEVLRSLGDALLRLALQTFVFGPLGNFLANLTGRAAGGSIFAGRPYVVGERGPEVVVPRTAGTVIPNAALGGQSINLTLNGVSDPETIVSVVRNVAIPEIRAAALAGARGRRLT